MMMKQQPRAQTPAIISPLPSLPASISAPSALGSGFRGAAYTATGGRSSRRAQGVGEQHRDRHRADPARHRRDRPGDLADRARSRRRRRGRRRCGWCRRRSRSRPGFTISAPTSRGEPTAATRMSAREQTAARSRVREWQTVTVAFSPSSSAGERPADEDRAAEDHRLGALELDPGVAQQLDHALRRARDEARAPLGEQPGAGRGEPVDVLGGVDRRDHRVLVDLLGQRQLDQDPVDRVVAVERGDQLEQLLRSGSRRRARGGSSASRPPRSACACCRRRPARPGRRRPARSPARARSPPCAAANSAHPGRDPRARPRPPPPCRRSPGRSRSRLGSAFDSASGDPLQRRVVGHQLALRAVARRSGSRPPTPGSTAVTTPSPKLAWTTSSPTE